MSQIAIRVLNESEHDRWDRFVATSHGGSPYHTACYLAILCRATGGRFKIVVAEQGNELVGGAALYFESEFGVPVITTRLLLYYGGLVLKRYDTRYPSETTSRHLRSQAALVEAIEREGAQAIRLRSPDPSYDARVLLDRGWSASPTYSYVVPLADRDLILARVEQNLRRLITRAEGAGITVTQDNEVDAFLRLHHEVHERKGARLYLPDPAFRQYLADVQAAGIGRLYQARLPNGEIIATQLILADRHPVAHTVSAAAAGDQQATGANPLLRVTVFGRLAEEGFQGCDLTDAALNPVTRFKSQLGGTLTQSLLLERVTPRYRAMAALTRTRYRISGWARRLRRGS